MIEKRIHVGFVQDPCNFSGHLRRIYAESTQNICILVFYANFYHIMLCALQTPFCRFYVQFMFINARFMSSLCTFNAKIYRPFKQVHAEFKQPGIISNFKQNLCQKFYENSYLSFYAKFIREKYMWFMQINAVQVRGAPGGCILCRHWHDSP